MGSGEFSGPGQTPAIRQAPPLHFGGIRPLPNRTTTTKTSVTAPVVIMGPRDSPAPLWGQGNFQGRGKRQPSGRHRPSTLVELGKLPNRTTATITSVTAPVVTMASYGGVSTSTSLGRPFLSGHSPEQPGLGPMGQPQQQWSRAIPQGVQLPYTQGTSEIPMERPLTGVFKGASPQLGSNSCSSYGTGHQFVP